MHTQTLFTLLLLMISTQQFAHAELRFSSGPTQTRMIELYTSEGCNSCPPAEKFLNSFKQDARLWREIIPVAFHVDYWDYLGWKDRFSRAEYSARQREYARVQHARTVYTPAFFINGQNWRAGLFNRQLPDFTPAQIGTLDVRIENNTLTARYQAPPSQRDPVELHVAILGADIISHIQAGENAGRESQHDFVVLAHQQLRGSHNQWQGPLSRPRLQAPRYALAAWVSTRHDPTPLQATGGWLPGELFPASP